MIIRLERSRSSQVLKTSDNEFLARFTALDELQTAVAAPAWPWFVASFQRPADDSISHLALEESQLKPTIATALPWFVPIERPNFDWSQETFEEPDFRIAITQNWPWFARATTASDDRSSASIEESEFKPLADWSWPFVLYQPEDEIQRGVGLHGIAPYFSVLFAAANYFPELRKSPETEDLVKAPDFVAVS